MFASLLKAILEWLSGLVKSEIKQDVKASDADTPQEIVDDFRSTMRRKLRDNESSVHKDGE
jgi:hypothetical protein